MQAKRLEIVIDAHHAPKATAALRRVGVPGYTIVPNAAGWGDRGERAADELTGVFNNCYVLCACPPDLADAAIEAVRPMVEQHGGLLLISDADLLA